MQPASTQVGGRAEPTRVTAPTRNTAMTTPQHLSDRYELGEILGFGGMSEVHLARDVRLHRDVAVKVLRADLARDPSFYLRFRREAQNAAALNHPSIVAVYDTREARAPTPPPRPSGPSRSSPTHARRRTSAIRTASFTATSSRPTS